MTIRDDELISVDQPPMSSTESSYLPEVFKGLGTTMKHMVKAAGRRKGTKSFFYPEDRREHMDVREGGMYRGNYRGVHRLNRDESGRVKCVACFMCQTACPAHCIHIEAEEAPWEDREKYPAKFDIDELRCIYCGMCEEACPVDAIELTHVYDIVGTSRAEMVFDKEKLLEVYDRTIEEKPM